MFFYTDYFRLRFVKHLSVSFFSVFFSPLPCNDVGFSNRVLRFDVDSSFFSRRIYKNGVLSITSILFRLLHFVAVVTPGV